MKKLALGVLFVAVALGAAAPVKAEESRLLGKFVTVEIKSPEGHGSLQTTACPSRGWGLDQVPGRPGDVRPDPINPIPIPGPLPIPSSNPNGYGDIVDTIVNIGSKVWSIVEANRPVVNIKSNYATAIPRGVEDWATLECWSRPAVKTYRTTYKNYLGARPVDFVYRVLFTYNGRSNGNGRYLSNVTIVPVELHVSWGYKFSVETVVGNILNAGTSSDPVAALELDLNWSVETPLKHLRESESFYVRGDGYFEKLQRR